VRAAIQKQIAPTTGKSTQKLNNAEITNQTGVVRDTTDDIDFKSVLMQSNEVVTRQRDARKNGDLSTADSYESFLEELAAQTEQKNSPKNTMDKDDFLTLFVTQLQQQDPLNPQDGTEMAAQLAQFNSLEQMMNVNSTLENLVSAQENSKKLQFLNYVGKEVSIDGGKIALQKGDINDVTFFSDRELGRSTMIVKNGNGQEVFRKELGVLGAGKHKLSWDGMGTDGKKQAEGIYSVDVKAMTANGDPVQVALNSSVKIKGVDLVKDGNNLYTDIGPINFADVQAVGEKGFKQTDKVQTADGIETLTNEEQVKALQDEKEKNLKAKKNGAAPEGDPSLAKNQKTAATEQASAEQNKKQAPAAQANPANPNEGLSPEMLARAQQMAKQMGYSLDPSGAGATATGSPNVAAAPQTAAKSGRIPISSGQHANAPGATQNR
jgi:flagellar basal-body rod modification protein FlgD